MGFFKNDTFLFFALLGLALTICYIFNIRKYFYISLTFVFFWRVCLPITYVFDICIYCSTIDAFRNINRKKLFFRFNRKFYK